MKILKAVKNSEEIFGMATVGRHQNPNFLVSVNPDSNRAGICYFKYYNSDDYTKATHVTRLNFRIPEKVSHKNRDGKKEWELNSHDRDAICEYLDAPSKSNRALNVTNWVVALYHWNDEIGLLEADYPEEYESKLHAFMNGFFDTDDNLKKLSYVSSKLVRPNYKEIKN